MWLRLIVSALVFLTFVDCSKYHYIQDGVKKYAECMKKASGVDVQEPAAAFFDILYTTPSGNTETCKYSFVEEKVIGEMKRKGSSDSCTPMSTTQLMVNRNSATMTQHFSETITINRSEEKISSSSVTMSAEARASISKAGVSAEVGSTSGKETTTSSENSTTQNWQRDYQIPPFMKGTADMLECKRLVDIPTVTIWRMKGCVVLNITGDVPKNSWKKCGTEPLGVTWLTGKYVLPLENFKDEWLPDEDGGLIKRFSNPNLMQLPFTKFVRKARIISDEAASKEYCRTLDPNAKSKAIEQEILTDDDEVEEVSISEKDLSDFSSDWDVSMDNEGGGDHDDDDDDKKKKDKKCKSRKCKQAKKKTDKNAPKSKRPSRKSKKRSG